MKRTVLIIISLLAISGVFAQNSLIKGTWKIEIEKDGAHLYMKYKGEEDNWNYSNTINMDDLSGYKNGQNVVFYLRRDAGEIKFTGDVNKEGGEGEFEFSVEDTYVKGMKNLGFVDFTSKEYLLFTIRDFKIKDLSDIIDLGYKSIANNKVVAMVALGINAEFIKAIQQSGFQDIKIQKIIAFKALGVTADRIKELKTTFGNDLSVEDVTAFTALNIDAEYVEAMGKTGLDIKPEQLISFKAMNISPEYIKDMQNAGIGKVDAESFPALKAQGVDIEFVKDVKSMGFDEVDVQTVIKLKVFDFDMDYVKMIREAGYKTISLDDILQFKIMDIDRKFIEKAKTFNDGELPDPSGLIRLRTVKHKPNL